MGKVSITVAIVALQSLMNEFGCSVHVSIIHNLLVYTVVGNCKISEIEDEGGVGFSGIVSILL